MNIVLQPDNISFVHRMWPVLPDDFDQVAEHCRLCLLYQLMLGGGGNVVCLCYLVEACMSAIKVTCAMSRHYVNHFVDKSLPVNVSKVSE